MTILEFAQKNGYQTVKKEPQKWNGYTVYTPSFNDGKEHCIGLPYVILVKNGKARMSSFDETCTYMMKKKTA